MRKLLVLLSLLTLTLLAQADPIEVAGVRYDATAEVGGQKLQLNGAGIRYKFFIKIYTAGLYLANKAATPEDVLASPGPKRLHIVMLYGLSGEELGKLFTKGMQNNSTREQFAKSINGVIAISNLFAEKKNLEKGESFSVEYVPGTGTIVYINGKVAGEPIKEPEFYSTLLRIWLGDSPADKGLKEALLGRGRQR